MKKIITFITIIFTAIFLVACGNGTKINITLDYNDGVTANKVIEIDVDQKIDKPTDPTREGYIFEGWELDNKIVDLNEQTFSKSVTLVAKWEKVEETEPSETEISYVVSFVDEDQNVLLDPVSVVKGNKVAEPQDPTKEGYEFLGWYVGNQKFNFNTTINKDLVLVAKWKDLSASSEMTQENFLALLNDIDVLFDSDNAIMLTLAVDLEIELTEGQNDEEINTVIGLEGDLVFYIDLSSYEDFTMQIEGDLNLSLNALLEEEMEFDFEGILSLNAYVFNDNVYVDLEIDGLGFNYTIKQKVEGLFLEMFYDQLFEMFFEMGLDGSALVMVMTMIFEAVDFEDMELTVSENSVSLNIPFDDFFEILISEVSNEELIIHHATFTNTFLFVELSDRLERLGANLNIDLDLEVVDLIDDIPFDQFRFIVRGDLELEVDFNATNINLVKEVDLVGFEPFDQLKSIFNILSGEQIFEQMPIPEIDKTLNETNITINRENRMEQELDEELSEHFEDLIIELPLETASRVQADFDIYLKNMTTETTAFGNYYESYVELKANGDLDLYLNLTSFEDLYIYLILDVDFEAIVGDEHFMIYLEGELEAKLYIFDGNLYVDFSLAIPGQSLTAQVILPNIVTEESFDYFIDDILEDEELEMFLDPEILFGMIFQTISTDALEVYATLDYLDLEFHLDDFIEQAFKDFAEYEIVDEYNEHRLVVEEITSTDTFVISRFNNITNKLEMLGASLNLVIITDEENNYIDPEHETTESDTEYMEINLRFDIIAEFDIEPLNNLKTAQDFDDFFVVDEFMLMVLFDSLNDELPF